jgi:hypothetical protein
MVVKSVPSTLDMKAETLVSLARRTLATLEKKAEVAEIKALPILVDPDRRVLQVADLNNSIDNAVISRIIAGCIALGYRIEGSPGVFNVNESSVSLASFISGFFAEIVSNEKISTISYRKSAPFATGRACARYELLKGLTSQENQSYISGIPKEIAGDGTKAGRPYLSAACTTLAGNEGPALMRALQTLITNEIILNRAKVLQKFSKDFMCTSEELVSRSKRTAKIELKKGKRKTMVSRTLDPARPDTLSTVCPVEKPYVQAMFCKPWTDLAELRDAYNNAPMFERQPAKFVKRAHDLIELMWHHKSYVMKALRHREIRRESNRPTTLQRSIELTSNDLARFTDFRSISELWEHEKSIQWMFSFRSKEFKNYENSFFDDFVAANSRLAPITEFVGQFVAWMNRYQSDHPEERKDTGEDNSRRNLFENLNRDEESSHEDDA